jgi:hypothetical protein
MFKEVASMKITFKHGEKSRSGRFKSSDIVYHTYKAGKGNLLCIGKRYTYPTLKEHHHHAGAKAKAIAKIWKTLSPHFKQDCNIYAKHYFKEHCDQKIHPLTGYNIFFKGVFQLENPVKDINEIRNILGKTLEDWISNNYLSPLSTVTYFKASLKKQKQKRISLTVYK